MVDCVANLFTDQIGFEEYDNVVKLHESRKRGKYNKKIETDNTYQYLIILAHLISPYTYISEIYNHLAENYVPMPLLSKEATAFTFKGLAVTYSVYEPEAYTYYDYPTSGLEGNDEICSGEDFHIFEAELAGTEYFSVYERITLHTKLLDYLDQGVELEQATMRLQPDIERIKQVYDKEKADTLARDQSGIFKRV